MAKGQSACWAPGTHNHCDVLRSEVSRNALMRRRCLRAVAIAINYVNSHLQCNVSEGTCPAPATATPSASIV